MSNTIPAAYWKIVCAIFILLGIVATLFACALLAKTVVFVCNSAVTSGQILRVEYIGGRSKEWAPTYTFLDPSGVSHQKEGVSGNRDRWREGQQVEIRYRTTDPTESALNTFHDIWLLPTFVCGFCFGYLSFFVWLIRREEPNKSRLRTGHKLFKFTSTSAQSRPSERF